MQVEVKTLLEELLHSMPISGPPAITIDQKQYSHFSMIDYDLRLKTFSKWPFNRLKRQVKCTAEAMAKSGFYCPNPNIEPDTACCFLCMKTLDGWEKSDVPDEEHRRNQNSCHFLDMEEREFRNMTVDDIFQLKKMQYLTWIKNNNEQQKEHFNKGKENCLAILEK